MARYIDAKIALFYEIVGLEAHIEGLSNFDFRQIICSNAKELSKKTDVEYIEYLRRIIEMLLAGKTENEILWHFDKQLLDITE